MIVEKFKGAGATIKTQRKSRTNAKKEDKPTNQLVIFYLSVPLLQIRHRHGISSDLRSHPSRWSWHRLAALYDPILSPLRHIF